MTPQPKKETPKRALQLQPENRAGRVDLRLRESAPALGVDFNGLHFFYNEGFILLMDKILRDLTDPKLWE